MTKSVCTSARKRDQITHHPARRIELHVPAKARAQAAHAGDVLLDFGGRQPGTRKQVKPHRAHTGLVETVERCRVRALVDHHDAARDRTRHVQRVDQTTVVGAVETRLHDHEALQLQHAHHLQIVRELAVRQRVVRMLDLWIFVFGPEHVHVCVARERRHGERRPRQRLVVAHRRGNQRGFYHDLKVKVRIKVDVPARRARATPPDKHRCRCRQRRRARRLRGAIH